ncbi:MAG TPA: ABC transporter permease subunit, partial [Bacillota bacterium]|nr:ABC transporter permease subunit [Bacillota bacterium]
KLSSLIIVNSVFSSAGLILVAKGYFDAIPHSLDEAAKVDGASRMTILLRVIFPLALPILSFIAIQSFVISYNEYAVASAIMSEGVDTLPLAVGLQSMLHGQFGQNWSLYCAGAVLGSIPMIVLFYSLQKYFIGDLLAGGVKE